MPAFRTYTSPRWKARIPSASTQRAATDLAPSHNERGTILQENPWMNEEASACDRGSLSGRNDPSRAQYQLWIFDAKREQAHPVDGGVFDVRDGEVIVPIHAAIQVFAPKLFAVTVEKPGGVVVSKRERIVLTAAL